MSKQSRSTIVPMRIAATSSLFDSPNFLYELKLDGIRCIAHLSSNATLLYNEQNEPLHTYVPELQQLHRFASSDCILDGVLIVIKEGIPDYLELLKRFNPPTTKASDPPSFLPASFVAFDIIEEHKMRLTDLPLSYRKQRLEQLLTESSELMISRTVDTRGSDLYRLGMQLGFDGVIAKHKQSIYKINASTQDWMDIPFENLMSYLVCGLVTTWNKEHLLILGSTTDACVRFKGCVNITSVVDYHPWVLDSLRECCIPFNKSPFLHTPVFQRNSEIVYFQPTITCSVQTRSKGKKNMHSLHIPISPLKKSPANP